MISAKAAMSVSSFSIIIIKYCHILIWDKLQIYSVAILGKSKMKKTFRNNKIFYYL